MTAFVLTNVCISFLAAFLSLLALGAKPSWTSVTTVLVHGGLAVWGLFLLLK